MQRKLIIMGGNGNGMIVASAVEDNDDNISVLGFLNDFEPIGSLISNKYPVIGRVSDAVKFNVTDTYFHFAISSLKQREKFGDITEKLKDIGVPLNKYCTVIHKFSSVSKFSTIGTGSFIAPGVVIGPNVRIGDFVPIFGNAFVGHDSIVEDHCFIANNSSIGGFVELKTGAYIGTNSSVRERLVIGEWSVVGMGSVVIKDVLSNTTVAGVPAKLLSNIGR